jgi:phage gp36-like protein
MGCELYVGQVNTLFLSGLKDEEGYVNDATVLISIYGIIDDEAMEYVEDSDGVYKYVLPATAGLIEDDDYLVTMEASWIRGVTPYAASIEETYTAVANLPFFGPDVYANCRALYDVFGRSNVNKWADLDNDNEDATIRRRKAWALHRASRKLDELLQGGPYTLPFEMPYDNSIVDATARLAGVFLYESRGIEDSESALNNVSAHKEEVMQWAYRVKRGAIRLNMPAHARATFPQVVTDES